MVSKNRNKKKVSKSRVKTKAIAVVKKTTPKMASVPISKDGYLSLDLIKSGLNGIRFSVLRGGRRVGLKIDSKD